jgi:hypothetical protein
MAYTLTDEILALDDATVEFNYNFASDDTEVIPTLGEGATAEQPSLRDRFFGSRIGRATIAGLVATGLIGIASAAAEAAPDPAYTTASPAPSSDTGKQAISPYDSLIAYSQLPRPELGGQPTDIYDRQKATDWALANAQKTPPADGASAWFASNALWQGGLPKTKTWTSAGKASKEVPLSPTGIELSGSNAAWNVGALKKYLRKAYPGSEYKALDFMANKVPDAEGGDLIFYDWENDGKLDHASVVVDVVGTGYPEVAEWSAAADGSAALPYAKRGWTYSQLDHRWIQKDHSDVAAYLLHIDATSGN